MQFLTLSYSVFFTPKENRCNKSQHIPSSTGVTSLFFGSVPRSPGLNFLSERGECAEKAHIWSKQHTVFSLSLSVQAGDLLGERCVYMWPAQNGMQLTLIGSRAENRVIPVPGLSISSSLPMKILCSAALQPLVAKMNETKTNTGMSQTKKKQKKKTAHAKTFCFRLAT